MENVADKAFMLIARDALREIKYAELLSEINSTLELFTT